MNHIVILALAISSDGKYLVAATNSNGQGWDNHKKPLKKLETFKNFILNEKNSLAISLNGYVATVNSNNTNNVQVFQVDKQKNNQSKPLERHKGDVKAIVFSPNGEYVVTASTDGTAQIWETKSGEPIGSPLQHNKKNVNAVTFSCNGEYLATASADKVTRVWKVASGEEVTYLIHKDKVKEIAFSPDGKYLATLSDDNIVQVVPWAKEVLIKKACKYLTRNLTKDEWIQYLGSEPYRKTCPKLGSSSQRADLLNTILDFLLLIS